MIGRQGRRVEENLYQLILYVFFLTGGNARRVEETLNLETWNNLYIFPCCFNTVSSVSQVFLPYVPTGFLETRGSTQIIIYTFVCFPFFIRVLSRKSEFFQYSLTVISSHFLLLSYWVMWKFPTLTLSIIRCDYASCNLCKIPLYTWDLRVRKV